MVRSIQDIFDLKILAESVEVEFKLAGGKDGKGALPKDFWPSYSAMANGHGGWIILGVKEKKGQFIPVGIENSEKVRAELFNTANNREKISINLLAETDVQLVELQGLPVLAVHIRSASRKQKPVYINSRPFGGTYRRLHEGDCVCDDETVKRMLAEQIEDSRDDRILPHFDMSDIEVDSLMAYRQLLSAAKPQHPWLELDHFEFFKRLGGWRTDRETGKEGMTLAGILMFGTWSAIQDAAPHYFVDYQERPEAKTELRWVDRVCPDGTWSGNVFDFYRRVYRKLITDLKVPFEIKSGQRKGDTAIHIALREALVNSLVHADFSGRVSILIVKRPDMFGFRNPGLMRVPIEVALQGGDSDCRNRRMHQMFLLVGLGERAGSGLPKIYSGWTSANWRLPKLWEKDEPEQTLLELSTASLIPADILQQLSVQFGDRFAELSDFERVIVTTAATEGWINHERACELTTKHSREVTLTLPRLESKGFLASVGEKRNKSYTLPGASLPTPDEVFSPVYDPEQDPISSHYNDDNLTHNESSLTHSGDSLTHSESSLTSNGPRDLHGRFLSEHLDKPYIDNLESLSAELRGQLQGIAELAVLKRRLAPEQMRTIILDLCQDHFIAIGELGKLLHRTSQNIRQNHMKVMVNEKQLRMAFPREPNSPKQGYTTASEDSLSNKVD